MLRFRPGPRFRFKFRFGLSSAFGCLPLLLLCFLLCVLQLFYRIAFAVRNVALRFKYAKSPLDGHLRGSGGGGGDGGCGGGVGNAVASTVVIVDSALPGLLFLYHFR